MDDWHVQALHRGTTMPSDFLCAVSLVLLLVETMLLAHSRAHTAFVSTGSAELGTRRRIGRPITGAWSWCDEELVLCRRQAQLAVSGCGIVGTAAVRQARAERLSGQNQ